MPSPEVLCVGEVLWDALPEGLFLGGAPFNVACHLRAAGITAFVLFPRHVGTAMYDDIIARCRSAGFSPTVVQEATGWHTVASLVGAGVGVGLVPRSLASFQQHVSSIVRCAIARWR